MFIFAAYFHLKPEPWFIWLLDKSDTGNKILVVIFKVMNNDRVSLNLVDNKVYVSILAK